MARTARVALPEDDYLTVIGQWPTWSLRNDMLHARPATVGDAQRLYRWKPADRRGPGRAFVIDIPWLDRTIDELSKASTALGIVRPLHKHAAFAKRR